MLEHIAFSVVELSKHISSGELGNIVGMQHVIGSTFQQLGRGGQRLISLIQSEHKVQSQWRLHIQIVFINKVSRQSLCTLKNTLTWYGLLWMHKRRTFFAAFVGCLKVVFGNISLVRWLSISTMPKSIDCLPIERKRKNSPDFCCCCMASDGCVWWVWVRRMQKWLHFHAISFFFHTRRAMQISFTHCE